MAEKSRKEKFLQTIGCAIAKVDHLAHICKDPIQLSCKHFICKECIPSDLLHKSIECSICHEINNKDLDHDSNVTKCFKKFIIENIGELFSFLQETFDEKLNNCKQIISNREETIDLNIEFIKGEIEIRIESLKIELDKIRESFFQKADDIKVKWISKNSNNNNDNEQFYFEKYCHEYQRLSDDIANRKNLTENSLYEYQNEIRYFDEYLKKLENNIPRVVFSSFDDEFDPTYVGEIFHNIDDGGGLIDQPIMYRIKTNNYHNITCENNTKPCDMCVLPNGNLLACDYNNAALYLYDDKLELTRKIESISGNKYNVLSIDTNKHNAIYLCDYNKSIIIKTDLEFNEVKRFGNDSGSNEDQLKDPCGICYHNGLLYICDNGNNRIKVLNQDLDYHSSYSQSYTPWYIKFINNVVCVRDNSAAIHFHDLNSNFKEIRVYNGHNGVIGASNSYFYEYYKRSKVLYCYKSDGSLYKEFLDNEFNFDAVNGSICLYNDKLVICSRTYMVVI